MSAVQDTLTRLDRPFPPTPWGVNDDGDVADEGGELVAINPRTGTFPSALIAAAPELYAALDLAYRGGMVDMAGSDFRDRVEAILAKVRGS